MTDDTTDVDLERAYDRDDLAGVFREFAAALDESRPLRIDDGNRAVAVSPPPRTVTAIRAGLDRDAEPPVAGLELELEWDDPEGTTLEPVARDRDDDVEPVEPAGPTGRDPTADPAMAAMPPEAVARSDESEGDPPGEDVAVTPDRTSRFEVYEDRAGEWRWRLVHWNGNIVADSGEGYTSRSNAKRAARSVIRTASTATIEDIED